MKYRTIFEAARLAGLVFTCHLFFLACNISDDSPPVTDGNNGESNNTAANAGNNITTNNGSTPCTDLSACPSRSGARASSCDDGSCSYVCEAGFSDDNGDLDSADGDGCEATCTESNGGVETCDGVDNDCNGIVDDGFSVGDACSDGVGACEAMGEIVCSEDGTTSMCSVSAGDPTAEVCDGVDNDCDGDVDEGNPGGGGTCDTGEEGACQNGTETCQGGVLTCVANNQPETEACGADNTGDGVDNDCDGELDEDCDDCTEGATRDCYTGSTDTEGVGACSAGIQTCTGGSYGTCENEQLPMAETCNGVDDNCDGDIDEDYGDKGDNCSAGVGLCRSNGVRVCAPDGQGTTCNAVPGTPGTESCNNLDDDCDGDIDESLSRSCGSNIGVCMEGTETCSAGQWGACLGGAGPSVETCNGVDDDCNGSEDDGFNVGTACTIGTGACESSGTVECTPTGGAACDATPGTAGTEACNDIDDDCDGSVDESLSRNCSTNVGECSQGTESCSAGSWVNCTGVLPSPEMCNGKDDDCDGADDEDFTTLGNACTTGVGACRNSGSIVCKPNGSGTRCNAVAGSPSLEGSPQTCSDGSDNDCDGFTDCADSTCDGVGCVAGMQLGTCQNGRCSAGGATCFPKCFSGTYCCNGNCIPNNQLCPL